VVGLETVELPDELAVSASYGLAVLGSSAGARKFADFILSSAGQATLQGFGFERLTAP
jgi:ABC-type molybdate transport system substrate-binding protein